MESSEVRVTGEYGTSPLTEVTFCRLRRSTWLGVDVKVFFTLLFYLIINLKVNT